MTQYHPSQIQSPIGMTHPYREVLTNIEEGKQGLVLAVLMNASQIKGDWTPVNGFPKEFHPVIAQMEKDGSLIKVGDGHIPSQEVIGRLAEYYLK